MIEAPHYSAAGAKHHEAVRAAGRSVRRRGERGRAAPGGEGLPREPAPGHREDQDAAASSRAATRSRGSRRAPAGRARARPARRTGAAAARRSARIPRDYRADMQPEGAPAGAPLGAQRPGARRHAARGGPVRDGQAQDQRADGAARPSSALGDTKTLILTAGSKPTRVSQRPQRAARRRAAVHRRDRVRHPARRCAGDRERGAERSACRRPTTRRRRTRREPTTAQAGEGQEDGGEGQGEAAPGPPRRRRLPKPKAAKKAGGARSRAKKKGSK